MNAATRAIKIDIISDTVCPFCFLGKRKLEKAIAAYRTTDDKRPISIRWHPYNLDPTLTKSINKREMYAAKFGPQRAEGIINMMTQRGKEEGINFSYGGMRGPTLDSHRLIDLAYDEGGESLQNTVVESLFKAYFEEELDIADLQVLADRAAACGMDAGKVKTFLESSERRDKIQKEIAAASRRGIQGVPHFTFNDRHELHPSSLVIA
ncbi:thioredoxin-like protein [Punctularia strigosozonata HHB-11173 SS5]|uniref:thioredoxin-like protein n=1 Tax=Punctularia strigosozonata (strain HHB-11173) TaxID=741275 RepID=UPI00044173E6|nr:thioredoxin-like protein [Punctularia strigosozonata HHB-11173 SS5]EIN14333.1 thioredoxin-like protein [Punctularia strigosozonata HHB-11173 SS5]